MELFTYLMAKNDHNTSVNKDLFSYLLGKGQSGTYQTFTGTSISANNTKKAKMKLDLLGNTSQTGTPTPDTPIPINVVSGDNTIKVEGKNLFDISKITALYNSSYSEPKANAGTIENGINAYWEGELGQVTITTHERNINARNKCIQSKGTKCFVCGFDFEKTYGELGKGFIHIHHVTPISNRDGRYEIEVENDLFPVCPNCHAMLHRRKDSILSIEELKLIIQQNND